MANNALKDKVTHLLSAALSLQELQEIQNGWDKQDVFDVAEDARDIRITALWENEQ